MCPCVTVLSPPPEKSAPPDRRLEEVEAFAEQLGATLRTAEVLVREQRRVELQGLDGLAGRLCAACLDLPPEYGRLMRRHLDALLVRVDALEAAMRLSGP